MPSRHSLCVHAHFYQPTREDPLTGIIPKEPGAYPHSNWNELIFEMCYKPNADLGNFSRISFDIGPTLSKWLRQYHPDMLKQIVDADRQNMEHYGVGNAIAQSYHHTILPLGKRRDKQTQIRWGIYEFERTFKHKPLGMWLPETAVDTETLEVLVENGIEFTILAPWQADSKEVDPRKAYQVILPGHKSIKVFFYHSGLSARVSFDPGATENADAFARNFVKPEFFSVDQNQWLMIATDGELYGHHQIFRDKFLSYLLDGSISAQHIETDFPALQLTQQKVFPVIKIREDTSWSCHHGVQRWSGVCSCTPNSEWKKPLREALEMISDEVDKIFVTSCKGVIENAWDARDKYIEVFGGDHKFADWLQNLSGSTLADEKVKQLERLFQAELECQRMFTSCGWFFNDLDRIEPKNAVTYAARAVWLTRQATGIDISLQVTDVLEKSKSWRNVVSALDFFKDAMDRFEQTR
ncbi:MAG: glycoside hydrolase [Anaerolinea sp.]|nr:glycoside hydrolase [Anaerolinea sp.]